MPDDNFSFLLMYTVLSPESILLIETLEKENGVSEEVLIEKIQNVDADILKLHLDKFIENKIIEKTDDKLFLTKYGNKLLREVRKALQKFKSMHLIQNQI